MRPYYKGEEDGEHGPVVNPGAFIKPSKSAMEAREDSYTFLPPPLSASEPLQQLIFCSSS